MTYCFANYNHFNNSIDILFDGNALFQLSCEDTSKALRAI